MRITPWYTFAFIVVLTALAGWVVLPGDTLDAGGYKADHPIQQGLDLQGGVQVTLEARCYGLARRYAPFLVNTVVGFIGPEYLYDASGVQRAGLEDHFMGKLLGLPMGVDACATNHMRGDHDDLENQALLLAAAGANYFMGVPMGDDVLLGYRSTSFHDAAALRETLGRRPAPFRVTRRHESGLRSGRC